MITSSLHNASVARRLPPVRSDAPAIDGAADWDPLLLCVAAYVLTSVGRVHQLFPVLDLVRPATLAGGLALLLYAVDRDERRRTARMLVPAARYILVLLAWMILSIPGALYPGNSFDLVFNNFVKTALTCFVTAAAIRSVRDVERLAFVYLLGVGTYAFVVVSRFDLGSGDDWRLGHLYYYDANDFATLAVTAIPFGVYFLHAAGRPRTRLLAAAALAVTTLAFVNSGSRGGFLALVAVGAFIVMRYRAIPLRWRVSATALVLVVLLIAASDRYWEQMGTIVSDTDYNHTGETGRLQIWDRGVGYMLQHPMLGVGPGNFPVAEGTISPLAERQQFGVGVRWSAAHNSFIQIGAEAGIPGLLLFVGMIAAACRGLRTPALAQAVRAALIGFAVGAFFLSLAYAEMLYTLLALAIGLQKVAAGIEA